MRFLCLHGRGTNSDIFESQLAPLFSRITVPHTFDFVDAPFDHFAAPGIAGVYPPPFLAWHPQYEPYHVQLVHDFLRTIIEEDGPYDGVIGFSEGAALAASFLLCHEHTRKLRGQNNEIDSPFKVAIFINSIMMLSPSPSIGSNISGEIRRQEAKHIAFVRGVETSSSEGDDDEIQDVASTRAANGQIDSAAQIFGFSPETFEGRILIPTLHVIGAKDPLVEHSRALVKLCQPHKAEVLVIDGGHEPPRTETALQQTADLFEMVVMMASLENS